MQCTEKTSHYQPGDKARRSNSTSPPQLPSLRHPLSLGHLFRPSVLQNSRLLRMDGLMVEAVGLMGTRIAGVDVAAYNNNRLALCSTLIQNKQALMWMERSPSNTENEELLLRKECGVKA